MKLTQLNAEIAKAAVTVSTDDFSMSLGEITNLYKDGDIIINPNFQRFFRWDTGRKSKLIESILLRIPIPPIFVFERIDGKWELIDGLQRLSTILEFMGELRDPDTGEKKPPIFLSGTQYLKSLHGAVWDEAFTGIDDEHELFPLDGTLQRSLKRAKLGVQVLEKKSDVKSKFDLFQRLNSGGMAANPQEIRNCTIIMSNERFFQRLRNLAQNEDFRRLVTLGEDSIKKANDFEHISRIVAFGFREYEVGVDIEEFVNQTLIDISSDESDARHQFIEERVYNVFRLIRQSMGDDGLRPYDDDRFHGRIGRTSIEIVFLGILYNYDKVTELEDPGGYLLSRTKEFWLSEHPREFTAAGVSGTDRVARTVPFGREWYDPGKNPPR